VEKLATYIVREGALDPSDSVGWAVRLTIALEVLHGAGVAHGRISARAIQVLGPGCQAAGFFLDTGELLDDPAYHSPERITSGRQSAEDDTWAVGVVLYHALTGSLPFAGDTAEEIRNNFESFGAAPLAVFGIEDRRLQGIIDGVFAPNFQQRLRTVVELRARLVECEPDAASLRPLHLGKPDLEIFDAESDDEGEKLTAVMDRGDWDKHIQAALRMRLAKGDPAPGSAPGAVPGSGKAPPSNPAPVSGDVLGLSWDDLPESPGYGIDRTSLEGGRDSKSSGQSGQRARTPSDSGGAAALEASDSQDRSSLAGSVGSLRPVHYLFVVLMVAVGGAAALLVYRPGLLGSFTDPGPSSDPATSTSAAPSAPPASSTQTSPSASAPAPTSSGSVPRPPSSASAAPPASSAPDKAVAPADASACMVPLFHRGTFGTTKPRLDFVCRQKDARLGGGNLRKAVIVGIRKTSSKPAMREWNQLGWYELAVFATLRAKCCAASPRLNTATGFKQCRLDAALIALGTVASEADEDGVAKAIDDFQAAVTCMVRHGAARGFKQPSARPKASAVAAFLKLVDRLNDGSSK